MRKCSEDIRTTLKLKIIIIIIMIMIIIIIIIISMFLGQGCEWGVCNTCKLRRRGLR